MGCCDSCLEKPPYAPIPQEEKAVELPSVENAPYQAQMETQSSAEEFNQPAGVEESSNELDPTLSIFEGLEMEQKFTNKSSYDTR